MQNVHDYITHEIRPPASEPEWVVEYLAAQMGRVSRTPAITNDLKAYCRNYPMALKDWQARLAWVTGRASKPPVPPKLETLILPIHGGYLGSAPSRGIEGDFGFEDDFGSFGEFHPTLPVRDWTPGVRIGDLDLGTMRKADPKSWLARLAAAEKPNPVMLLEFAQRLHAAGMLTEAVTAAANVAELAPENWKLILCAAELLRQWGFEEFASGLYQQAIRLAPNDYAPVRRLALGTAEAGDLAMAYELLGDSLSKTRDQISPVVLLSDGIDVLNHSDDDTLPKPPANSAQADLRVTVDWLGESGYELLVLAPDGTITSPSAPAGHTGAVLHGSSGSGAAEYLLGAAQAGAYQIRLRDHGEGGASLAIVDIVTNWGRKGARRQTIVACFAGSVASTLQVASIEF